jgi:hypothetical protein
MITVVVNFDLPQDMTLEGAAERFRSTAPKYRDVAGLIRKHYLFNADLHKGGGAYVFETRAQAEALFDDVWRERIKTTYGTEPSITFFETPVVVDNVAGEIVS